MFRGRVLFLSPDGQQGGNQGDQGSQGSQQNPDAGQQGTTGQQVQIDYDKIQKMMEGTLTAKEDTALKAYLKQQGLSEEEMKQAIATYKQKKAESTPDITVMQTQIEEAKKMAQQALLEKEATVAAIGLGLDTKQIPYVLKMADLSQAMGQDGKINADNVKAAINKVLEDVPALKPQQQQSTGFQVGAPGGTGQQTTTEDVLKKAFGL